MQNSIILPVESIDDASAKQPHKGDANSAPSSKPPVKPVLSQNKKGAGTLVSKNINKHSISIRNNIETRLAKETPATPATLSTAATALPTSLPTSSTSLVSRRTDAGSEEAPQKVKSKFIKPRLNQLAKQRIQLQHNALPETGNAGQLNVHPPQPRTKRNVGRSSSVSLVNQRSQLDMMGTKPCPELLLALQNQLEDRQSEFMQKVASFRDPGYGFVFKLVTIVRNNNCQVLVHNDDLLGLPKYLPERSVKDFMDIYRNVFEMYLVFIIEQIGSVQLAEDQATADAQREDLRARLQSELNDKLGIVDQELMQLCSAPAKEESSSLMRQICELMTLNVKLNNEIAEGDKEREELKRLLDLSKKLNHDLGLELAGKNTLLVEQGSVVDDQRAELTDNKTMCQRLNDNDVHLELSQKLFNQHVEQIGDLDVQRQREQADHFFLKQKTDELNAIIADKDSQIAEQKRQLAELKESGAWQQAAQMGPTASCEADRTLISEQKEELARVRVQLLAQEQVEQTLRDEIVAKQEALRKAELKQSRLDEQIKHHLQVLAVRGERINHLDQELKQQEFNRKLNDIMGLTSDRTTLINQLTSQLASTNEQFHKVYSTLSAKQTKLRSQEHVIKLLEECNERNVKLHAKMGAKNALLKDELDLLRRTLHNLVLKDDVSGMEVRITQQQQQQQQR